ncbi:MAG TPA: WcbI family polysaccharide biosynthesis putative acetyltransferase [Candidatus Rubrimentiphilum sp.]|nr:WcbI family polysaccharide biosynthesis putative acetyltransferase [Candidatus Rubrimentiphilum sp.]
MNAARTMIVHGDCQAEAVAAVLGRDPVVSERFRVIYSRSYDHPVEGRGNLPPADVSSCAVLCEQHDPIGFRQQALLPANCFTVKFPALDLNLLWPFNCVNPYNVPEPPLFPFGRFPYGDRVIVAKIDEGMPPAEIVKFYLERWDDYKLDLERLRSLEYARINARDTRCDIKMAGQVAERFALRQLFWAVNHPTNPLLEELIAQILRACERIDPQLVDADVSSTLATYFGPLGPLGAVSIPVHPKVAEYFELEWYDPRATYRNWDGSTFSYTEYFEALVRFSYANKTARLPA